MTALVAARNCYAQIFDVAVCAREQLTSRIPKHFFFPSRLISLACPLGDFTNLFLSRTRADAWPCCTRNAPSGSCRALEYIDEFLEWRGADPLVDPRTKLQYREERRERFEISTLYFLVFEQKKKQMWEYIGRDSTSKLISQKLSLKNRDIFPKYTLKGNIQCLN